MKPGLELVGMTEARIIAVTADGYTATIDNTANPNGRFYVCVMAPGYAEATSVADRDDVVPQCLRIIEAHRRRCTLRSHGRSGAIGEPHA